MATRRAAVIVDENLINHDGQTGAVKKTGLTTTTSAVAAAATRRPALGNLVNRTDKARILNDKKIATATNGTTENTNGTIDLKNVKARVDTHWKNEPIRKQLSRNNSIKKQPSNPTLNTLTSAPKLVRTKTIETATLKEAKLIDKSALLKRQDSTLSRRKPISGLAGASKIGSIDISKRTATRTKSNDSDVSTGSSKQIQEGPAIQSRFRPPSFTASYSNGLIDGFGGLNIDDGDEENALLVCEYVNDIYAYLFQMEQKYAIRKNHLDGQIEVHPRMRTVLVDWISEVHTQYHFAQETFHITVSIIDRYLQASKNTTRKNLQLVGVAALFVASKYEELYPPEVHDFVYITDNTYTKDEILKMEKFMLKKLKFEMGAPTPIHFLRRFSKAAQADNTTHTLSKYFIELAAVDYKLSEYLPSEIAAASLFVSLCLIHSHDNKDKSVEYESLWTSVLEFYSTYNVAHLQPIVKELIAYILDAPTSKQNNVYNKYSAQKQGEMAKICEKSSHILQKILEYAFC